MRVSANSQLSRDQFICPPIWALFYACVFDKLMKFLFFLTAFTGRNSLWFLPLNLLLTTLAYSQSSKINFIWRFFYYLRVAGVSKRISWGSDWGMFLLFANFISPICSYCLENQWSKMEKKRGWIDIFILQKKHAQWHKCFAIMPLTVRSLVVGNFKRHLVKYIKTGTACYLL